MAKAFRMVRMYGGSTLPHFSSDTEDLVISPRQQREIERQFGIFADIIEHYDSDSDPDGICAGPTYTDNAGMRWLGRGLPRPIDIPRLIDKFRLADEAHPI